MSATRDCTFCAIAARVAPADRVYEDDATFAIMDIHPQAPGHVLVIPKRHAAQIYDLDDAGAAELARALVRVARGIRAALSPEGLSVRQANGRAAGQDVMHVHVHLIPRGVAGEPTGRTPGERAAIAARIRAAIETAG
jgi:histidine triad (HIT) family protein